MLILSLLTTRRLSLSYNYENLISLESISCQNPGQDLTTEMIHTKKKKKSLIMLHIKSKGDPHVNLKREMFIVSASIGIFPTGLEDHLINLLWLLSTI